MAMTDVLFGPEIWEEDIIDSHIWVIDPSTPAGIDYSDLVVQQKHDEYDYLLMMIKLLPTGYIWNFEVGSPGDY